MNSFRLQLFHTLFGPGENLWRVRFERFFLFIISLNTLVILLESVDVIYLQYQLMFKSLELVFVAIFSIEYVLRIWCIVENERYQDPIKGRLRYAVSPFAIIDLLAILPFYLSFFTPLTRRQSHMAQILRLLRMFKMGRYFKAWDVFSYVYREKKNELKVTLYTILILLIVSSSVIYFLENPSQPEAFSSIPASMWWGVMTLTTVGYGDIVPITIGGRIFGAFIALLGIGLFALPAGILGSGFIDRILEKDNKDTKCPHCKKKIKAKSSNLTRIR